MHQCNLNLDEDLLFYTTLFSKSFFVAISNAEPIQRSELYIQHWIVVSLKVVLIVEILELVAIKSSCFLVILKACCIVVASNQVYELYHHHKGFVKEV